MTPVRRRTRKKRIPTRDWNPAMLSSVLKYSPPTNTPRNTDTMICARKNVLSLNPNRSISQPKPAPRPNERTSKGVSHEPSQYFPLSTRKHLQLRQKRSGALQAREFLQGASTFIWGSADDDGSKFFIKAWTLLFLLLFLRLGQCLWWHVRQVEEMIRDVIPGGTRRPLRRKIFCWRESS